MSTTPLTRFLAFALPLLLLACRTPEGNQPVNLKPTFSVKDKEPLGMYVAYQALQQALPGFVPDINKRNFNDYYKQYTAYDDDRSGNLFCIFARQFYPNEEDVDAMADFVSNGNTLLVASNQFNEVFLDKFHLRTRYTYSLQRAIAFGADMVETGLSMHDTAAFGRQSYRYFFYPLESQIYRETSYPSQRIANTDSNLPGAVVFRYGSGRIITVANATAFTNYFLLTRNNYHYLEQLLNYLPEELSTITWDSYYNANERQRSNESFSAFQELMRQPPMRWAFWLTLLLAATWIINGIIRRQRIIEVVKPATNTSVEFAKTIGRLYLQKRDNKNIAVKMITYFLDYVRSRYYLSTGKLDNHFANLLAAKSGQPLTQTENLLKTIDRINARDNISDMELLELNTLLRQFVN
jgi:hypothetical protein